jgi:hypothetical protein
MIMLNPPNSVGSSGRTMTRQEFMVILDAAMAVKEFRYARRLATAWLAAYPGDLPVKFTYAQSMVLDTNLSSGNQAIEILESICNTDPEYLEAQELLSSLRQSLGLETQYISKGCVLALSMTPRPLASKGEFAPIWARQLHEARQAMAKYQRGDQLSLDKAEHAIHQALVENPETPLAAVTHLIIMAARREMPAQALLSLAQIYHERWPECLQFTLFLAHRWMESGNSSLAVVLLHQAVARDITGQVPTRLWGVDHPYRSLWPERIDLSASNPNSPQNLPIPASVASRLGWNQLPAPALETIFIPLKAEPEQSTEEVEQEQPSDHETILQDTPQIIAKAIPVKQPKPTQNLSEPIRAVQNEFKQLAKHLKTPHLAEKDGNFPVFVVLTTRKGIQAQYGDEAARKIDDELKRFVRLLRGQRINHETWGAILFYADDPEYTAFFELQPVAHNDPWAIKLILADLDVALRKGGERIGALLIIGGPEIVPFHSLPNPVDDADTEVMSDNPYASLDENYFILEWPIGRLPGGSTTDATPLLNNIRALIQKYAASKRPAPWYKKALLILKHLLRSRNDSHQYTFGYTAAVWRRAALAVYRTIGDPQELLVSPPVHACEEEYRPIDQCETGFTNDTNCLLMPGARLAYFNLHGIPDSPFWYGHRDPTEPLPGVEFPVALRPQDIRNGGNAPHLIFSEACYGAYIQGKNLEDALALKFLASGTQAIIGSTCISYGSISTPLSAADLLGRVFYGILEEGHPAGEALRRAKLHLVREMHRRQGYLDPEDQKTLISFILLGDPLAQPYRPRRNPKSISRRSDLPKTIQTISENPKSKERPAPVPPEMVAHVKNIVAQYLPGMTDAHLRMTQTHAGMVDLSSNASMDKRKLPGSPTPAAQVTDRQVITLSKTILQSRITHNQYARLTLDSSGKLLKLTVSR